MFLFFHLKAMNFLGINFSHTVNDKKKRFFNFFVIYELSPPDFQNFDGHKFLDKIYLKKKHLTTHCSKPQ